MVERGWSGTNESIILYVSSRQLFIAVHSLFNLGVVLKDSPYLYLKERPIKLSKDTSSIRIKFGSNNREVKILSHRCDQRVPPAVSGFQTGFELFLCPHLGVLFSPGLRWSSSCQTQVPNGSMGEERKRDKGQAQLPFYLKERKKERNNQPNKQTNISLETAIGVYICAYSSLGRTVVM